MRGYVKRDETPEWVPAKYTLVLEFARKIPPS